MKNKELYMEIDFETLGLATKEDLKVVTFGGYGFMVGEREIQFDFEAYGVKHLETLPDGRSKLRYASGKGCLFDCTDIDDCFDEEYIKMGLSRDAITAEYLSKATKISELFYECYTDNSEEHFMPILVTSITLINENKKRFSLSQELIDELNLVHFSEYIEGTLFNDPEAETKLVTFLSSSPIDIRFIDVDGESTHMSFTWDDEHLMQENYDHIDTADILNPMVDLDEIMELSSITGKYTQDDESERLSILKKLSEQLSSATLLRRCTWGNFESFLEEVAASKTVSKAIAIITK